MAVETDINGAVVDQFVPEEYRENATTFVLIGLKSSNLAQKILWASI